MKSFIIAAVTGLLSFSGSAVSAAQNAPAMVLGSAVSPPLGFAEMCERHPEECMLNNAAARVTSAEVRVWAAQARWAAIFSGAPLAPASSYARATYIGSNAPAALSASRFPMTFEREAQATSWSSLLGSWKQGGAASDGAVVEAGRDEAEIAAASNEPSQSSVTVAQDVAERLREPNEVATPLSGVSKKALAKINNRVNRSISRASDAELYGRNDYWAAPSEGVTAGDCEDYVLAKRHALIEAGAPAGALSIALVRTARGEMHAVLLVATEAGEMVLDNLSPWVDRWDRAPYEWVERQVGGSPVDWVRIPARSAI